MLCGLIPTLNDLCTDLIHTIILVNYLVGPGALSLGRALFTSTNLPSIVCSVAITTSAATIKGKIEINKYSLHIN